MINPRAILLLAVSLFAGSCHAQTIEQTDIDRFIEEMESRHGFDRNRLHAIFRDINISSSVLEAISRPAEKLPWYRYRPIFIRQDRINQGVDFWRRYEKELYRAGVEFGVPPEIIVAIIGVETQYGRTTGKYRVIDSLATLGFHYPPRGEFFLSELEQFLLLTREQGLDPLSIRGSYAGAMGIPQFISSSYRHYAIDFDSDGHIDIWNNPADAIGSVGNYFRQHGWLNGKPVAIRARVAGDRYRELLTDVLEPNIEIAQLRQHDIQSDKELPGDALVKLIELESDNGDEHWLAMHNFYVITRYNHSPLYAMAVFQLAQEIRESHAKQSASRAQSIIH